MSLETLNRPSTPFLTRLDGDIVLSPDLGGAQEPAFKASDYQILVTGAPDRISPIPELEKPIEIPVIDFTKDLRGIARIRRLFNEEGVILPDRTNYDLPAATWAAQEARLAGTVEGFKQYETEQIKRALGERYNVSEKPIIYLIDESSRLRNEEYSDEPATVKFARGNVYQKQQGSPDTEREEKELEGFLKVERLLTDPATPINTKMMVMSPPSQLEGTSYVKNFVDFYELVKNEKTDKRVVKMTRFATDATYSEEVTDAYLLSHPTRIDPIDSRSVEHIFADKFSQGKDLAEEKEKQTILNKSAARIKYYIDTLCNPSSSAESIFISFQAVLNGADEVARGFARIVQTVFKGVEKVFNKMPTFKSIAEEVRYRGRLPVELIKAACGTSGGGSFKGISGGVRSIMKSIRGNFESAFKNRNGCSACGRMGVELECGVCDNCKTE